jgi:hypothetical protein
MDPDVHPARKLDPDPQAKSSDPKRYQNQVFIFFYA